MGSVALTRVIVVGETANVEFLQSRPFDWLLERGAFTDGPSRKRLENFGLRLNELTSLNLCSPGRWDPDEACDNAHVLVGMCLNSLKPHTILAFGARAGMAFGLSFSPGRVKQVEDVSIVSCAHPSGLSRWWNDPENVFKFKELIRGLT